VYAYRYVQKLENSTCIVLEFALQGDYKLKLVHGVVSKQEKAAGGGGGNKNCHGRAPAHAGAGCLALPWARSVRKASRLASWRMRPARGTDRCELGGSDCPDVDGGKEEVPLYDFSLEFNFNRCLRYPHLPLGIAPFQTTSEKPARAVSTA
jgi:hypothetical protein